MYAVDTIRRINLFIYNVIVAKNCVTLLLRKYPDRCDSKRKIKILLVFVLQISHLVHISTLKITHRWVYGLACYYSR